MTGPAQRSTHGSPGSAEASLDLHVQAPGTADGPEEAESFPSPPWWPFGIALGFSLLFGHTYTFLNSSLEGDQLQPGEILVTVATNVGWTPLFPRLAAVVTDVGAPLSHAAIVARELGIPAVVGCFNATSILKTGDRVRVDGARGIVEILEN